MLEPTPPLEKPPSNVKNEYYIVINYLLGLLHLIVCTKSFKISEIVSVNKKLMTGTSPGQKSFSNNISLNVWLIFARLTLFCLVFFLNSNIIE